MVDITNFLLVGRVGVICDANCKLVRPKSQVEACNMLGVMALENVRCDEGCITVPGSADFYLKNNDPFCTARYSKKCMEIKDSTSYQYEETSDQNEYEYQRSSQR